MLRWQPRPRPDVRVRAATPDDAEAIAAMARALSVSDGGRPSRLTAETFRRDGFGPEPAFQAVIAEADGTPAGYAVFYPGYDTDSASRGVYLSDLYVSARARRAGVGSALMAAVADRCRQAGGRWMFWSVLRRNRSARRFYRTMAPELSDVRVCAAFGATFDRLADRARSRGGADVQAGELQDVGLDDVAPGFRNVAHKG
ncbi:MAG: N-acetyltransferase family protein [Rhodospirillales bacterium]